MQIVQRIKLKGIKVGIITNGHPKVRSNLHIDNQIAFPFILALIFVLWPSIQVQRAKLSACRADEIFNTILVGGGNSNTLKMCIVTFPFTPSSFILIPFLWPMVQIRVSHNYRLCPLDKWNQNKLMNWSIHFIFTEEVHQKPHKSIFLKACELVGTRPEESVMVGDSLKTDIQVLDFRLFSNKKST